MSLFVTGTRFQLGTLRVLCRSAARPSLAQRGVCHYTLIKSICSEAHCLSRVILGRRCAALRPRDRQCPLICIFTRSRADGWRYVCEKLGRPPLRFRWLTQPPLRPVAGHQASRKKRIIFSFGTWPGLFFSLSILRLTHRYLDRSSELHFISIRT